MYGNRCVLSASEDGAGGDAYFSGRRGAATGFIGRIRDYVKMCPETGGAVGFMFLR